MKKTIKLKYVDQDSKFNKQEDGPFFEILNERYDIEFSETPQYVIYSPFGNEHLKYEDSVKIFYSGECISPDFNLCDYAIGFDYISFGDRYFRYPLWLKYGYEHNYRMQQKHLNITNDLAARDFCAWVVSNDFADSVRDELFYDISKYKQIDSGGKYLNNIGQPEGVVDKLSFQNKHKFVLACENTSYPGYTTEKLMEAFEAISVPIYWGDPKVVETFNDKSFINATGKSIDEILRQIKYLDENDEAYLSMLSEPALISDQFGLAFQERKLAEFLFAIFDQDVEKAFRRNRQCWGKKYSNTMSEYAEAYRKFTMPRRKIKELLNKIGIER